MKFDKKLFLKCTLTPLVVGAVASLLTMGGMKSFAALRQPFLSPPAWLFPVAWTILYLLMGAASYLVYTAKAEPEELENAVTIYMAQLLVNFLWPTFFFNFQWYLFSFLWLLFLWILVFLTTKRFYRISKTAGCLMLPYLLWLIFAGYLNFGVWLLN